MAGLIRYKYFAYGYEVLVFRLRCSPPEGHDEPAEAASTSREWRRCDLTLEWGAFEREWRQ